MSDSIAPSSVLIISDDTELVETLVNKNSTGQEFLARDSVQFIFDDPSLLDNNSIVIFDIETNGNDVDGAIDQILKIKQQDPTQVLMLTGESDLLGEILKSNIQPLIFRAFTKPVSANQMFLAFKSANSLHNDLVEKQAAGEDISIVGSADNKTNIDSLVSERSNNTVMYAAAGVVALAIIAWLLFSGGDDSQNQIVVNDPTVDEFADVGEVSVSASVQKINALNQLASTAMLEDRVISPKGNNALEYYDQVLAIDAYDTTAYQGKKSVADRLRSSYDSLVGNAEFDRELSVINVLQRIEPLNLQNDSLRQNLEKAIDSHVKKVQETGTSEEIARTAAVLEKIDSEFEGSKSASEALKAEKELVAKIDASLEKNVLIPPNKGNAYSLVSEALKANSVSKANIEPRVESLSSKLLKLANSSLKEDNLDEAGKLSALIKRLNVDKKGLASLNKGINQRKAAIAAEAEKKQKPVQEQVAAIEAKPEPPKIIPAKIIERAQPRYPNRALNKNQEGWVQLSFKIDTKGHPINVEVLEAKPRGVFDKAALKAVEKWRFSPARNEETGLPIESNTITTKVQFKLG
jgi:TonB family protein